MNTKISLDDVISQLRNSSMERIVESGRIKGGLSQAQDGCHCKAEAASAAPVGLG